MSSNPVDFIPIHTSDRQNFKKCRQRWHFSSPARMNLVPKRSAFGINFALWFGTGIHYALEHWYSQEADIKNMAYQGLGRGSTPAEYFQSWYDEEYYHMGVQAYEWLEQNDQEMAEHLQLGLGMMKFYEEYARKNDDFEVLAAERDFAVPIPAADHTVVQGTPGRAFTHYDVRTEQALPVMYCGRMDMTIRDSDGLLGIMDHKTQGLTVSTEDFLEGLTMDEQATSYLWAHEQEGTKASYILYNILRKGYPRPPTRTYKGEALSLNRQAETTTLEMFERDAQTMGLVGSEWWRSEKVVAYREFLKEQGDEQFIIRRKIRRNNHEIFMAGRQIALEAKDMLSNPAIYRAPSREYGCLRCAFRAPCLATYDGSDVDYLLEESYEKNTDR